MGEFFIGPCSLGGNNLEKGNGKKQRVAAQKEGERKAGTTELNR